MPNSLLEKLHYYLVSKRMQYSIIFNDIPESFKPGKYITYEPGLRSKLYLNKLHKWNINIITTDQNYITPSVMWQNILLTLLFMFILYKAYKLYKLHG